MTFEGTVAVVTGGAGGIGAAICRELAGQGAAVGVADLDGGRAAALAAELGDKAVGTALDVTDPDSVRDGLATVADALGEITALVNNAGIDVISRFVDSTPETWDLLIDVNLKGTISCTRAVLDAMLARGGGRIVNIASDAGRVGSTGEVVYSATKGGVIAFTKALARETAKAQVTVNAICPGPTQTPLLAQMSEETPKLVASLERIIPLRRIAEPADIAPAVAFLLSDGARYITGQTLSVSGGLTMA